MPRLTLVVIFCLLSLMAPKITSATLPAKGTLASFWNRSTSRLPPPSSLAVLAAEEAVLRPAPELRPDPLAYLAGYGDPADSSSDDDDPVAMPWRDKDGKRRFVSG